ncbi:hypothetical protein [Paracoccus salsus]|uniref:hypothetical protein n=1 Tax=Paracoccus salsus TaxID=2911061 RepID=UPI001F4097E4|nr:hypothetical protein [Paracoccus salsus]MCF3973115.1 hypothetical protein [Paracoccus salsus]
MNKLTILVAALPATALAHAGDHGQAGAFHVLTAPDHRAVAALVAALMVCVWIWQRGRS